MAGWYTNEQGIKGQKDINALISAFRTGEKGAYDPLTNPNGAKDNYYMDAIRRRIQELSGTDLSLGDDAVRLGYQGLEEQRQRQDLGKEQQKQILSFADEQQGRANDYRKTLASSLADSGQKFFQMVNPDILEDLNSRGLFTSQTARDQSQADALKEIELNNQQQLMNFDTGVFNDINDIRGSGLSALLGGSQAGLDAALAARKAGLQRSFDLADQARAESQAHMLAKRRSRDQLTGSLLGVGGTLLGSAFGGPVGGMVGGQAAQMFQGGGGGYGYAPAYRLGQRPGYSFLPPSLSLY